MKTKFFLGTFVLLLSAVLVSCGPNDVKIQQEVTKNLIATSLPVAGVVEKGVVTLTGTVENDDQKAQAETAVKAVKGVKSVTNNVVVVPPITPDQALTTLVQEKMTAAGFSTVTISVAAGILTLAGDVKDADLINVMQIANESGAKQVINNMTILK